MFQDLSCSVVTAALVRGRSSHERQNKLVLLGRSFLVTGQMPRTLSLVKWLCQFALVMFGYIIRDRASLKRKPTLITYTYMGFRVLSFLRLMGVNGV